ncbi:hypothetical protein [Falsirhodobacter algicola]|uniref:Uncharacterized protein n=1 Tax=Falsirhodobacter algicola TaxID=2692330 RepID=A0A8J8MVI3_9RHOB|nr:hypothetical protein [Falsirhodobacter algicola]QUS37038.1 hypothetical protein GR316_11640 [Falsirhodobacter algicola]
MTQTEDTTIDRLEGLLIAHRKILAELIATVQKLDPALAERLDDHSVLHDGQEDPGAVPTDGVAIELASAEETERVMSLSRVARQTEGGDD